MSDRTSIEASVLNVLSDVLETSHAELRATPVLAAHPWDSLATLEALVQVEAECGVSLDLRTYHGVRTVDDLIELVLVAKAVT